MNVVADDIQLGSSRWGLCYWFPNVLVYDTQIKMPPWSLQTGKGSVAFANVFVLGV